MLVSRVLVQGRDGSFCLCRRSGRVDSMWGISLFCGVVRRNLTVCYRNFGKKLSDLPSVFKQSKNLSILEDGAGKLSWKFGTNYRSKQRSTPEGQSLHYGRSGKSPLHSPYCCVVTSGDFHDLKVIKTKLNWLPLSTKERSTHNSSTCDIWDCMTCAI